jgi:hypothetical protein
MKVCYDPSGYVRWYETAVLMSVSIQSVLLHHFGNVLGYVGLGDPIILEEDLTGMNAG